MSYASSESAYLTRVKLPAVMRGNAASLTSVWMTPVQMYRVAKVVSVEKVIVYLVALRSHAALMNSVSMDHAQARAVVASYVLMSRYVSKASVNPIHVWTSTVEMERLVY